MRIFYATGYLLGFGLNLAAKPLAAHARLLAENAELNAENEALAAITSDLAEQLARADAEIRKAWGIEADLAELASVETFQDFSWLTGGAS